MMKIAVFVLALSALATVGHSYRNTHPVFPIDNLLECYVPNPFRLQPGQPDEKLEDIPVIQFQPGHRGDVYLPLKSRYDPPLGGIDEELLSGFVGTQLNNQLVTFTSRSAQTLPAPAARGIISLRIDTSSGADTAAGPGVRSEPLGDEIPATIALLDQLEADGLILASERILFDMVARHMFDNCTLLTRWERLPHGYWPPYYAAGYCSGLGCSLPPGLYCEPDIKPEFIMHIVVVRWDCCWNYRNMRWRFECGWRKVRIPIISRCYCGCGPRYQGLGFSAQQRINGYIQTSVDNLNT